MPKHPHMIKLFDGRTWKCVLDGCAFFVHMGLTHVLIGKRAICYECREVFVIDENSINTAKMQGTVMCDECITNMIEHPATTPEPTPALKQAATKKKVVDPYAPVTHAADCAVWNLREEPCDCGAE